MDRISYKRADTLSELNQILELQRINLPESLSAEDRVGEGFVTVHHDLDILQRMNEACKHIIAIVNDEVLGYALCMSPLFREDIPILKPMFIKIDQVLPNASYMVMGQICIDKKFRKQGVFQGLYKFMVSQMKPDYDYIVTEVDRKNTRSMGAHKHVGFITLLTYAADGHDWEMLGLKL